MVERFELDRYDSPSWFITHVASAMKLEGTFGEPCCGGLSLVSVLLELGLTGWTNDIDPTTIADYHLDATNPDNWKEFPEVDWVVTNPPYGSQAFSIVQNSYAKARKGIIFFLRTTWDEPCDNRSTWLWEHPLTAKFIYPRFKFRKNVQHKWATDACTIAAFIWVKEPGEVKFFTKHKFLSIPKEKIMGFYCNPSEEPLGNFKSIQLFCQGIKSYY